MCIERNGHDMEPIQPLVENLISLKVTGDESSIRINKKVQKTNKHRESQFKINPIGNNINLISQDFANTFIASNSTSNYAQDIAVDDSNFPLLGRHVKYFKKHKKNPIEFKSGISNQKIFSLQDFIKTKPSDNPNKCNKKSKPVSNVKYAGNILDSSLPVRKSGKCREIPKPKKLSKLKQEIIQEKLELDQNCDEKTVDVFDKNIVLNDEPVCNFISRVVELQEKLFKRDSIKGKYKRRYVVGLHEAKKYLILKKVKIVIIATDIKFTKENGALQSAIQEIVDLCKHNSIYYVFALKRRKLGILTLKYIPISCIAILNYEGAEVQFEEIIKCVGIIQNEESDNYISEEATVVVNDVFQNKVLELIKNK